MIMKYECECGNVHRSKIDNLFVIDDGIKGVISNIKRVIKAGTVSIIASEDMSEYASDLKVQLDANGYTYKVAIICESEEGFRENAEKVADISAVSELTIYIGGEYISSLACGGHDMYIITSLAFTSPISDGNSYVLVDVSAISKSPLSHVASGYGKLITKLLCVLDYRAITTCEKSGECLDILSKIESSIISLFESRYVYYRDGDFTRDLISTVLQVAVYESMLKSGDILHNYDVVSNNVRTVIGGKIFVGECDMLVGWYSFNVLKSVLNYGRADLFYPADIVADAERIATLTNRKLKQVVSNISIVKSCEVARLTYVIDEYRDDITSYISSIWDSLIMAMKNYRRIYYDAGLALSRSISLEKLSDVISGSLCEQKHFSIVKLLRINGKI